MTPQLMTQLFITFFLFKVIFQLYLNFRNQSHVEKNKNQVPEKFCDKITLEDHQKAAQYTIIKSQTGRLFFTIDSLILLGWTLGGGLNFLDQYLRTFNYSPIVTGTLLFALFSLIGIILELPQSLYETFVIEEKFGFNRTTLKVFFTDLFKQLFLGALIGLPFLAALIAIIEKASMNWWLYAWIFLSSFQLILMWAYPTFIAPLFNKFSTLPDGPIKDRIIALLERTQFNYQGLYVMDASKRSSHGNAYFTGFGKNKRIVFFDTLMNGLEPEEVEAVLAHELGHFKLKHIVKGLVKAMLFSLLGLWILGQLAKSPWFYQGLNIEIPSSYMALLLFSLVTPIFTFLITPLFSWSSRRHEFEADQFATQYSNGKKLISALIKMYKDNASTLTPDPLFSKFYHSHPPALERIEQLEKNILKS